MPEPNYRPPYLIAENVAGWPLWVLIDHRVTVLIECDGCHHRAEWTPAYMREAFPAFAGKSLFWLAPRLRCLQCRSHYVRLWGEERSRKPTGITR